MALTARIDTPRLILDPFRVDAVTDQYVGWLNNPSVVRYSEQRHRTHTRESCLDYVNSIDHESAHLWRILVKSERHIGNISAHRDSDNRSADIGIMIGDVSEWGKGYGEEAWTAVMDWLLQSGAEIVSAGAMETNAGMLRIFQKTGMTPCGTRDFCFLFNSRRVGARFYMKTSLANGQTEA